MPSITPLITAMRSDAVRMASMVRAISAMVVLPRSVTPQAC